MLKGKKKIAVLIFIVVAVVWILVRWNQNRSEVPSKVWEVNFSQNIEECLLLEKGVSNSGDVVLVVDIEDRWRYYSNMIPNKFLVLEQGKKSWETFKEPWSYEITKFKQYDLLFYDIETKEWIKTIDAKSIIESKPGYQTDESPLFLSINGKYFLKICLTKIKKTEEEEDTYEWVYYDIEEEEIVKEPPYQASAESIEQAKSFYIWRGSWRDYEFLEINGLPNIDTQDEAKYFQAWTYPGFDGYTQINITSNLLPQNNEELYTNFPALKDYKGKEGYAISVFLEGYPTAEEIMRMFLEDGQEISFEGAVLKAEQSIDGQGHDIHSFEEFYQWYKPKEESI